MSIRKTIGGDRLGSGKKMKVDLKSYERSTHNLNYAFRSTMAAGTLVPFYKRPILPGSTFDFELDADALTHPTEGPLFGSYKLQLDLFLVPMRLYIARLHNNESGLGMDMDNVHIPQIQLNTQWKTTDLNADSDIDGMQIEQSSLLSYLGMKGAGHTETGSQGQVLRQFNAIPYLAYWEIYKNYYANQQEEVGAFINNPLQVAITSANLRTRPGSGNDATLTTTQSATPNGTFGTGTGQSNEIAIVFSTANQALINPTGIEVWVTPNTASNEPIPITNIATWEFQGTSTVIYKPYRSRPYSIYGYKQTAPSNLSPKVDFFPLKNVDLMKRQVLIQDYASPLIINNTSLKPYNEILITSGTASSNEFRAKAQQNQQSLALKTHQNDIFNNWMNTEWIDGENGINSITAVQIVDDKLEIPSLILARKVFNVLNRIALSGGTYDDWLEVTYDHQRLSRYESPAYMGGLIKEIEFQEVISTGATETSNGEQPLGTLAGRGIVPGRGKGGSVTIKTDEPAYIIGIASITPRVDYSQGNDWDVNLKNINELHKPELDQIGFQDLITDQMAWWDTQTVSNETQFKSAGKQPAWINYQTDYNKCYGNFAKANEQMWMTLNRRYEFNLTGSKPQIKDLTSYIDPAKYNHIFSYTARDAQNFWVQIGLKVTARQKMSAKVMPNL